MIPKYRSLSTTSQDDAAANRSIMSYPVPQGALEIRSLAKVNE